MVVTKTAAFTKWFSNVRDLQAYAAILVRLVRLEEGNLGDWKTVGKGVIELRVDVGAGYRIYLTRVGEDAFVLLGGTKATQARDILKAQAAAAPDSKSAPKPAATRAKKKTKPAKGRDP